MFLCESDISIHVLPQEAAIEVTIGRLEFGPGDLEPHGIETHLCEIGVVRFFVKSKTLVSVARIVHASQQYRASNGVRNPGAVDREKTRCLRGDGCSAREYHAQYYGQDEERDDSAMAHEFSPLSV